MSAVLCSFLKLYVIACIMHVANYIHSLHLRMRTSHFEAICCAHHYTCRTVRALVTCCLWQRLRALFVQLSLCRVILRLSTMYPTDVRTICTTRAHTLFPYFRISVLPYFRIFHIIAPMVLRVIRAPCLHPSFFRYEVYSHT